MTVLDLLKKHFGYDEFRPLQAEIIASVLERRDTLVLMPTGGGKSLCYQLPALRFDGLTLVISPLIALMKDQVDTLKANGIAAEFINSSLTYPELNSVRTRVRRNAVKILYVAPERLALSGFQDFLAGLKVSLVAVDEAHCISMWGHEFRPDYRNLVDLRRLLPGVPFIALTATATELVRRDVAEQLELTRSQEFIASFNRANLTYTCGPSETPWLRWRTCCTSTGASRASCTAFPVRARKTWLPACVTGVFPHCPTTPAWTIQYGARLRRNSSATTRSSSWRPSPSGWV